MLPSDKLRANAVRREFEKALSGKEEFDLARSALLMAAEEEPGVDIEEYIGLLRQWGDDVRERCENGRQSPLTTLLTFLYQSFGLRGNLTAYYDPKNSFLNHVLDRGLGIPISLGVVLIAVGRRAGLRVDGVGMPGHFLVRVQYPENARSMLVDPFRGERISRGDCQRRLDDIFDGQMKLRNEHLQIVSDRQTLERMLRNLKSVYMRYGLNRRALSVTDRILLVVPGSLADIRDRGALRAKTGDFAGAVKDFEAFLARTGDGPESVDATRQLKKARMGLAELN